MIGWRIKIAALLVYGAASMAIGAYVVDIKWQSDWDAHMLADAQANENTAKHALAKQQKLIKERDDATRKAAWLQAVHDRNIADALAASDRLRAELDRIKALPEITHTSTIAERANAATDRLLLAKLLGESDQRAGEYAAQADRNRQAVVNCNNEYNAVRTAINER